MKLVITEKPSVAFAIAKVIGATKKHDGYLEGDDYWVSWCFGHLLELSGPELYDEAYKHWSYDSLPIIPEKWKLNIIKGKKKQLLSLFSLMNDDSVDSIVCATDAGREGELIFRRVYLYSRCRKPVERLWISSMEDSAIKKGFENLRPGSDYDLLYESASCRAEADWLVGINATRLFSVLYNTKLNVGRVMSPTLAILVQREEEIQRFQSKPFYVPELIFEGFTASAERTDSRESAQSVVNACQGKTASVTAINIQKKTAQPPLLYDLTTLQRESNRVFGYTAQQTLDYLQSLYEKKLVTYPRTDSRYLTEDMRDTAEKLIRWLRENTAVGKGYMGNADIKRITNNTKVTDHHAIIPTVEIAESEQAELPLGERNVLSLIAVRLLTSTAQPQIYEATTVTLSCAGHNFVAAGKTELQAGWKSIERAFFAQIKQSPDKEDSSLPKLYEGQQFNQVKASVHEGKTAPPKRYTEDSLLSAMESAGAEETPDDAKRKGLGTPATRAGILEKLVSTGYVERKKKLLIPTQKGVVLITVLPEIIKSPLLTAEWESRLLQIERGELRADRFMNGIENMVRELVRANGSPDRTYLSLFSKRKDDREIIGVCPRCGSAVREGQRGFFCENRDCSFILWRENRFLGNMRKTLTKEMASALLKEGRIYVNDLYSRKKNTTFGAYLVLDNTNDRYTGFKLEFPKRKSRCK